jgi:hypothetical protein
MAFDASEQTKKQAVNSQLLLLELNEVNFEQVLHYVEQGRLPAFKAFFDKHGYETTSSELEYEHLEPWIQWVTAHTGLSFAEHGIFRLGDIAHHDLPQIWEQVEARGQKVGAISPMNAKCRTKNAAFFVPDPWTGGEVVAPGVLKRLYGSIAAAVNENASGRVTPRALIDLVIGGAVYARPRNWLRYASLVAGARSGAWRRALFLDQLLADVFVRSVRSAQPNFATLFLNAAAHIQHHYLYSSPAYSGPMKNPDWYVPDGEDPLFEVYALYDRVLADLRETFPTARIMIATGLHQDPHDAVTFYWRLKDHEAFLRRLGATFQSVEPRMSRDFLVVCSDEAEALETERRLMNAVAADGRPLFEIDNRGRDLFVMLTWPDDIPDTLSFSQEGCDLGPLKPHVAFVAIKNGQHNGVGYFSDSNASGPLAAGTFKLAELPQRVLAAFSRV